MSDTAQGPGWWLASDGKWYSPEQAAGTPPPQTVTSNPVQVQAASQPKQTNSITIDGAAVPPLVAIGAGSLVVLGSLLAWATVSAGIINASAAGTDGDGKVTLIFGLVAIAAVAIFMKIRSVWLLIGAGVAFLVCLGVSIYDTINVSSTHIGNSVIQAHVSVGIGLWLCLIASILGAATVAYMFANQRSKVAT